MPEHLCFCPVDHFKINIALWAGKRSKKSHPRSNICLIKPSHNFLLRFFGKFSTMATMFDQFYESLQQYADRAHSLLPEQTGQSFFFDYGYLFETVVMPAFRVACALYAVHFGLVIPVFNQILPRKIQVTSVSGKKETLTRDRMAFQATNLGVNFILTAIGFYFEFDERRKMGVNDVYYRLEGLNEMGRLPAWQIGVQLWSFPIGLLMIHEDPVMLIHHVALVWVALLPCCFRIGYRWHTPFFFG